MLKAQVLFRVHDKRYQTNFKIYVVIDMLKLEVANCAQNQKKNGLNGQIFKRFGHIWAPLFLKWAYIAHLEVKWA